MNVECDKETVSSMTPRFLAGAAEHMVSFTLMERLEEDEKKVGA